MRYGIELNNGKSVEFIGEMSLSIGDGLDLDTRFGYDASKRPQSIARRTRNTAKTASLNILVSRVATPDLFKELEKYEKCAGGLGAFYWQGANLGLWCIKDVSFALSIDSIDIITALQITLNLCEGFAAQKTKSVSVNLM